MTTLDENVLRLVLEGAPESWIVASTAKVESLQELVGTDCPLVLAKAQQLMKLMPSPAPADGAHGPGGGSAYNDGGQSLPKATAPTGSQTPINTKLDTEASNEYDLNDRDGWLLVTPEMGYKTPYFASYAHLRGVFKQDRGVSADVPRYTLHVHCNNIDPLSASRVMRTAIHSVDVTPTALATARVLGTLRV
jgi:hypothetical protein